MPCQSDYHIPSQSDIDSYTSSYRKQLDEVTAMLCALCRIVEAHHPDSLIQQSAGAVPSIREWWAKHKKIDAKEMEAKAAKRAKEELVQQALNKLTIEERKALGL